MHESRWFLRLSSAALFGISYLTVWLTSYIESVFATNSVGTDPNRFRFLIAFGGTNMDYSTRAMEVCWWNHPFIILIILGWVFARASGAVAGEIERGTIDLTLSRPLSRRVYLTSHVLCALLGLIALVGSLIAGNLAAGLYFKLNSPPGFLVLLKPAANLIALGMAIFGYTVPISTMDSVRWRSILIGFSFTLIGILGLTFAPIVDGYKWLEKLSVFQFYAPVTIVLKGEPLLYNSMILLTVFSLGMAVAYWSFSRRDLPSNS